MDEYGKFNLFSLFLGIVLVVASIFAFRNPNATFLTLSAMLGGVAVIRGAMCLIRYFLIKDVTTFKDKLKLGLGIVLIALGIVLLFRPAFMETVIGIAVALFFIGDAVKNLLGAHVYRNIGGGFYIFNIVLDLVILVGGVLILFQPVAVGISISIVIGISMLISGIEYILSAFFNSI